MDEWQTRALQFLALASASAALPGGAVLVAYSIRNDFFPTLIETVSVPQLVFISVVVAFIFFAGLGFGLGLLFWLLWLLVRRRSPERRRHIFLPNERILRLGGVILSFGMLVLVVRTLLVSTVPGHYDALKLIAYSSRSVCAWFIP